MILEPYQIRADALTRRLSDACEGESQADMLVALNTLIVLLLTDAAPAPRSPAMDALLEASRGFIASWNAFMRERAAGATPGRSH